MTTPHPGRPSPSGVPGPDSPVQRAIRPWIGVMFTCANEYLRVSRSPDASVYRARCPKCGKSVRFRVGEGGSDARFFEVSC